ncbi:S-layer homology domain-containing protein [Nitriliruptoraceae bacterium ZYF776]|nr:S-layer homology domain-containing protein [Profundirhabdus halotolerans]
MSGVEQRRRGRRADEAGPARHQHPHLRRPRVVSDPPARTLARAAVTRRTSGSGAPGDGRHVWRRAARERSHVGSVRRTGRTVAIATAAAMVGMVLPAASAAAPSAAGDEVTTSAAPAPPRGASAACPGAPTSDFGDIAGSPHARAIRCLADLGVTQGLPGGDRYGPRRTVTRGQMASFLAAAIEVTAGPLPAAAPRFDDVPAAGYPHAAAIDRLAAIGIAEGRRGGSSFDPQGAGDARADGIVRAPHPVLPRRRRGGQRVGAAGRVARRLPRRRRLGPRTPHRRHRGRRHRAGVRRQHLPSERPGAT